MPDKPTTGDTDPKHWDALFAELRDLVTTAAAKADAAHDQAVAVRTELGAKLDELTGNVSKLASARLLQQALTSLVLAALIVVGIKALGG